MQNNCAVGVLTVCTIVCCWLVTIAHSRAAAFGYPTDRLHRRPSCPNGFIQEPMHLRRCFKVLLIKTDWVSAKGYCEAMQATLAQVASQEEHDFLVREINSLLYWTRHKKLRRVIFWLGGNDLAVEGRWRWLGDNSVIGGVNHYLNWANRQPDNKKDSEHCLAMRSNVKQTSFKWNDMNCARQNYFICYKKLPA